LLSKQAAFSASVLLFAHETVIVARRRFAPDEALVECVEGLELAAVGATVQGALDLGDEGAAADGNTARPLVSAQSFCKRLANR